MNTFHSSLLSDNEPEAFELYNPHGTASLVIVSDHAARRTPRALSNLGLTAEHFEQHIAYDIGTDAVTRALATRLDARAVLATYSRLVVDLNRAPGEAGSIPVRSDQTPIPNNQNLSADAAMQRIESLHIPYHDAIAREVATLKRRDGHPPMVFSVHSFTPMMNAKARPWDVAVLWNRDGHMAKPLMEYLRQCDGLHVGDNEPYSGHELAYPINRHGAAHGAANCAVEIRQDHCSTAEDAMRWADILADALRPILKSPLFHMDVRHEQD